MDQPEILAVSARLALSKLPALVTIASMTVGNPVTSGISRCAAMSCTVHAPHRLRVASCSGVNVTSRSASSRRSSAIISMTCMNRH